MNGWVNTLKKKISFKSMRLEMVMDWVENGRILLLRPYLHLRSVFRCRGKIFPIPVPSGDLISDGITGALHVIFLLPILLFGSSLNFIKV